MPPHALVSAPNPMLAVPGMAGMMFPQTVTPAPVATPRPPQQKVRSHALAIIDPKTNTPIDLSSDQAARSKAPTPSSAKQEESVVPEVNPSQLIALPHKSQSMNKLQETS